MLVYRLVRKPFAEPLNGKGAALKGARWNSIGVEMIYTAGNRSLAMAEVAVHLTLATLPPDYVMVTILIPEGVSICQQPIADLPPNWREFPHPISTQFIGDRFVWENKAAVLQIPSVVTQGDYNFLINPNHPEAKNIAIQSIEKFPFDKRILK